MLAHENVVTKRVCTIRNLNMYKELAKQRGRRIFFSFFVGTSILLGTQTIRDKSVKEKDFTRKTTAVFTSPFLG